MNDEVTRLKAAAWDALNTLPQEVENQLQTLREIRGTVEEISYATNPRYDRGDELRIAVPAELLRKLLTATGVRGDHI